MCTNPVIPAMRRADPLRQAERVESEVRVRRSEWTLVGTYSALWKRLDELFRDSTRQIRVSALPESVADDIVHMLAKVLVEAAMS
jgi:hypothetical protein